MTIRKQNRAPGGTPRWVTRTASSPGALTPTGPVPTSRSSSRAARTSRTGGSRATGRSASRDDRLVFVPTVLDTALGAKRREILLDEISEIERFPISPDSGISLGGRRPRMILHTPECAYELMVGDLDAWIDSLEKVYAIRAKKGRTYCPAITREGYVNLLLVEE